MPHTTLHSFHVEAFECLRPFWDAHLPVGACCWCDCQARFVLRLSLWRRLFLELLDVSGEVIVGTMVIIEAISPSLACVG